LHLGGWTLHPFIVSVWKQYMLVGPGHVTHGGQMEWDSGRQVRCQYSRGLRDIGQGRMEEFIRFRFHYQNQWDRIPSDVEYQEIASLPGGLSVFRAHHADYRQEFLIEYPGDVLPLALPA
jgi:hypothetical protein